MIEQISSKDRILDEIAITIKKIDIDRPNELELIDIQVFLSYS